MRNIILLATTSALFALTACSPTQAPTEKTLTIVNAVAVDAATAEQIQAFVSQQLSIPVRVINEPHLTGDDSFQALEKEAAKHRHPMDVIYVVLTGVDDGQHLAVFQESRIALVNTLPLYTDNTEVFIRRLERQVMRAAAFCIGLPPTPDPFCVTRDYRSIEDLDKMGRNFSPPWQGRFAEKAKELGLVIEDEEGGLKGSTAP